MRNEQTIVVARACYVGLSIATLLAQHNHAVLVDVVPKKVEKVNKRISPIQDDYIEKYYKEKDLNLTRKLDGKEDYRDAPQNSYKRPPKGDF